MSGKYYWASSNKDMVTDAYKHGIDERFLFLNKPAQLNNLSHKNKITVQQLNAVEKGL